MKRGARADYFRRYKEQNREKRRAHKRIAKAVKSGKVIRPLRCQKCRNPGLTEAHHEDYGRPLDVVWVCKLCHAELDRLRREAVEEG